jgi:Family of unknown function (DUF695)
MKRLLISLVLVLASLPSLSADVLQWATATSKQEGTGRAIVFRYAKEFRKGFQMGALPERIIVVWKYKSEAGMPSVEERKSMDRMEDLIAPLVDTAGMSVLSLVSTGEGIREWIFYTKSEQYFFEELNSALATQPRFPIEIHAASDPTWETYKKFKKGVRE